MNDLFEEKVLKVVAQIPLGCVATYGQIAQLIGYGRLAPDWEEQGTILWAEGVEYKSNGCVDLKKYKWKAEETQL